jgi:hypothetical protein
MIIVSALRNFAKVQKMMSQISIEKKKSVEQKEQLKIASS